MLNLSLNVSFLRVFEQCHLLMSHNFAEYVSNPMQIRVLLHALFVSCIGS